MFYFIDVEYAKLETKRCIDWHAAFPNLTSAEQYCSHDVRCKGIYDDGCDGDVFKLCEIGFDYKYSNISCVYDKRGIQKYLIKQQIIVL